MSTDTVPCGLGRRLLAIVYDSIVVLGLVLIAAVPFVLATGGAMGQSFAFRSSLRAYELLVAFAFFGGFWHYGGQTIGMRAWRIRVVADGGGAVSWRGAGIRYIVALLSWAFVGAGFLWSLVDRDRRTWHDIASATRLVREPRAQDRAGVPTPCGEATPRRSPRTGRRA